MIRGEDMEKFKNRYFDRNDSIPKLILIYAVLILFCLISVYPLLNVLSISLRPTNSLFSTSLKIIPDNATFSNYHKLFSQYDFIRWIGNSAFISLAAAAIGVIISITASYAFSRFRFRGRKMGLKMLLIAQMFPVTMTLLPLYLLMLKLKIANYFGLLVVYISTTIPFNIWLLKGFFDTIPKSLEESAYVDGANVYNAFYKIVLPLAKPAIALSFLNSFMGAWSEYIVARIIITQEDKLTIPIGLTNMQGNFTTEWGIYSAGALITAIPVMIVFIALSKYLVGGLTLGSVKE